MRFTLHLSPAEGESIRFRVSLSPQANQTEVSEHRSGTMGDDRLVGRSIGVMLSCTG